MTARIVALLALWEEEIATGEQEVRIAPEGLGRDLATVWLKAARGCRDQLEVALVEPEDAEPDEPSVMGAGCGLSPMPTQAEAQAAALAREADPAAPEPIAGKTPQQWAAWLDDIDQIEGCYATSNGATVIRQLQQQIATLTADLDYQRKGREQLADALGLPDSVSLRTYGKVIKAAIARIAEVTTLTAELAAAKVEHTRAILHYTFKGYMAGENADSKAWRERAEAAEAQLAAALLRERPAPSLDHGTLTPSAAWDCCEANKRENEREAQDPPVVDDLHVALARQANTLAEKKP